MSDSHTLLVNATHEPLCFLSKRRVMRLLVKEKIEVLAFWEDVTVGHGSGEKQQMPALARLLVRAPRATRPPKFHRRTLFERDGWRCQYCSAELTRRGATIDHLMPRCKGGRTSYANCVSSCLSCNKRKGHKSLAEANMQLAKKPVNPTVVHVWRADSHGRWHDSWEPYVGPA